MIQEIVLKLMKNIPISTLTLKATTNTKYIINEIQISKLASVEDVWYIHVKTNSIYQL